MDESVSDKIQNRANYNYSYIVIVSVIAAMGGLLFGYDLGIITGAIPFLQRQFNIDGFSLGWVVAIFELGCMAGTFLTAYLADKLGRKKSMLCIAAYFIVTTTGVAFSQNTFQLTIGRFLQGAGVGAASILCPMYIAEIAPSKIRGRLVSINQLTIILGILLATIASYYYGDPDNLESWRWMFGFAIIPSIVFFFALNVIPESPRWLINKNYDIKAKSTLLKIGDSRFAEYEFEQIQKSLSKKEKAITYKKMFTKPILPVLMMGFGIATIQQFSGSNNVTAYLQVIFEKANISIRDGLFNAVFVGLIFFIFTILAIFLIDKIGRRKLMIFGTFFMAVFLFLLAWSFNSYAINGKIVFVFVLCFIATYAFTLAPVTWVLLSEIFPNRVRGRALSLSSAVLWLSCFLVVLVSPYLLKISPVINFIIFGVFNLFGMLFFWRFVPETKGKSLEQIETMLIK
ncbi:MAG TPA: sugar porter family MFS transporter [Flavitalea sp.]|nr:sugar porter family MFS transporter [Flavitalea sp.]